MSPWQNRNLITIKKRLATVQRMPPGILFERQSQYNYIVVRRTTDQLLLCYRHLHHRVEEIESRLGLSDPLALMSQYTQAMLLALAWQPAPRRALLLGLGGGRLQLVLHHYLESLDLYTVEIDPLVGDVAQRFFGFATDERQHLIINDGRAYLRSFPSEAPYDLIFLDAYRAGGVPLHLSTREFYGECRSVLAPHGAVVTNLQSGVPLYDAVRKTFATMFRYTIVFPLFSGNVIIVGSDSEQLSLEEICLRTVSVQQRYGFDFALPNWARTATVSAPFRPRAPILRDANVLKENPSSVKR
jgi:spermidine synthase